MAKNGKRMQVNARECKGMQGNAKEYKQMQTNGQRIQVNSSKTTSNGKRLQTQTASNASNALDKRSSLILIADGHYGQHAVDCGDCLMY